MNLSEPKDFDIKDTRSEYDVTSINIYFYADSKSTDKPNFSWTSYECIFKRTFYDKEDNFIQARHYRYTTGLDAAGNKIAPQLVADKEGPISKFKMTPREAEEKVKVHEKAILQKPQLLIGGLQEKQVLYINGYEREKNSYTLTDFKREFSKEIYSIKNKQGKLVNPVSDLLGRPREISEEKASRTKERLLNSPYDSNYWNGGFEIMEEESKKLRPVHSSLYYIGYFLKFAAALTPEISEKILDNLIKFIESNNVSDDLTITPSGKGAIADILLSGLEHEEKKQLSPHIIKFSRLKNIQEVLDSLADALLIIIKDPKIHQIIRDSLKKFTKEETPSKETAIRSLKKTREAIPRIFKN